MKYCLIYVFSEIPFKMVTITFKFTAKVTFKFTAKPESPSSLLPESPSSLPPHLKLSFMADEVLPDLCLQWEPIWNCSSVLLKFIAQVYSSSSPVSFTPPHQLSTDLWNITTPKKFHIYQNAHILQPDVPPLQLTTDVWNTITPNKFHLAKNAHIPMADRPPCNWPYIHATPLHPISFTYRRM